MADEAAVLRSKRQISPFFKVGSIRRNLRHAKMHKRWSIFPAILALCFNTALLSALPNPKDLRSRHANINDAGTPTSGPSSILTRRDYFHLGDGWTVHWNSLDFFFPNYPAAAQSLIDLYDSIIDKIAADWSFEPDQPARRVKYGDITFDIQSNQAISLGWLTQFCLNAVS